MGYERCLSGFAGPTSTGGYGWKAADGAEQAIDSSAPILAVPGKVSRPESGHSFRLPVCCGDRRAASDKVARGSISPNLIRNGSVAKV